MGPRLALTLSPGGEWYVENLLEELDEPGEWYLDPDLRLLYYWPNHTTPIHTLSFVAAQRTSVLHASGTQVRQLLPHLAHATLTVTRGQTCRRRLGATGCAGSPLLVMDAAPAPAPAGPCSLTP